MCGSKQSIVSAVAVTSFPYEEEFHAIYLGGAAGTAGHVTIKDPSGQTVTYNNLLSGRYHDINGTEIISIGGAAANVVVGKYHA